MKIPIVEPRDLAANPHHYFALYRDQSPLIKIDQNRVICTRAKDVYGFLVDPRLPQADEANIRDITGDMPHFTRFAVHSALYSNGQVHQSRRKVWSAGFSPRATKDYKIYVDDAVAHTCDEFSQDTGKSFIYDLCQEIPERVISEILGIELSFMQGIRELAVNVGAGIPLLFDQRDGMHIDNACRQLEMRVAEHMQDDPKGDIVTILKTHRGEQPSSKEATEYISNLMLLMVAGVNTTRNALSTAFLFMMQDAQLWERLKDDSDFVERVVSESLRFEPAVGAVPRVAAVDIEISGCHVVQGTHVILSLSSALQDPAMFEKPQEFQPMRSNYKQADLRFGKGFHRCIGQPLARQMIEETIRYVAARYPNTRLGDSDLDYTTFGGLRRIDHLPVLLG